PPATYGIVLRGLKNANATQYPSILFPMGGTYLKDGKAALDSKEQVAALEMYAGLLRQYGPPGVVNFNWYECSASFMQGQVAIYMAGVGVGRTSTWDSPDVKAKPKMPADWYQAYQASLKIGRQGLPEIVGVTEYRDIIGVAIQKGIEGAPAAQVLAQAQKDFQDLL